MCVYFDVLALVYSYIDCYMLMKLCILVLVVILAVFKNFGV